MISSWSLSLVCINGSLQKLLQRRIMVGPENHIYFEMPVEKESCRSHQIDA